MAPVRFDHMCGNELVAFIVECYRLCVCVRVLCIVFSNRSSDTLPVPIVVCLIPPPSNFISHLIFILLSQRLADLCLDPEL